MGILDIGNIFGFNWGDSGNTTYNVAGLSLQEQMALAEHNARLQYTGLSNSALATLDVNRQLMNYQYELERASRRSSFNDTKYDLLTAGYNPLLAVGHQSNYTPVSSGVSAIDRETEAINNNASKVSAVSSLANMASNTYATMQQGQRFKSMNMTDLINALSNRSLNAAKIENLNSATIGQDIQNNIQSLVGLDQAVATLRNTQSNTRLNEQQIKKLQSDIVTSNYENLLLQSQAQNNNITSALASQNMPRAVNASNWERRHPRLSGFLYGIGKMSGAVPNVFFKGGTTHNH